MKENSRKGWLLFLSGDLNLALPLESLLRLVEAGSWGGRRSAAARGKIVEVELDGRSIPLVDPADLSQGVRREGEPEGLAVVEERGLTAAVIMDKIVGIREEPAVSRRSLPDRLSLSAGPFDGLIEGEEGIFLVLDPRRIVARGRGGPT